MRPATSTLFMGRKLGARLTSMIGNLVVVHLREVGWQDVGEQVSGIVISLLEASGRLRCDHMADDLRADLDQLFLERIFAIPGGGEIPPRARLASSGASAILGRTKLPPIPIYWSDVNVTCNPSRGRGMGQYFHSGL